MIFNLEGFLNRNISWRSRYYRTLNSRSYIDGTVLLLATLSRENPRKPGISVLLIYTSATVEALDLDTRKWPHRCNDGDCFHELVCVFVLDVLGTGSYETSPPLMSYRGADERYFHIALFPKLHALHCDANRCPSFAHVCIGTSV